MKINHELKSWIGLFEPIYDGSKTHDLRVLDREYNVGNICHLREWDAVNRIYTGRSVLVEITYITSKLHSPCAFSPIALHDSMGVLSIKKIGEAPKSKKPIVDLQEYFDD